MLTGEVDALKVAAPYRVVELDLTPTQVEVLRDLDGVTDSGHDGHHHRLRVTRDLDIRRLLATVGADDVQHFVYTTPSLTHLFTEAVA